MWHSLIAFIDNKTLFQIGIGLCRISFPMRLLLPFERGRPLLQLSSDDSSPAVDSDLSQQKKKKKQTNPNITNLSPLMTRWQPPQPKLPSPAPDIGACPRQSMKGGWRWVWLRTRGCWERSLFGESLPALFLPFSESGREAKEKSRETSTLSGKGGRSNARWSPCRMEWTSLGTAV